MTSKTPPVRVSRQHETAAVSVFAEGVFLDLRLAL